MNVSEYTALVKRKALEIGFEYCGFSKADFLEEEAPRLEKWLNEKHNASMHYMEQNFDKRLDPRILVPGAKSVVSLLLNYFPEKEITPAPYKISKYAYGSDYHLVIKKKLSILMNYIKEVVGHVEGRMFVDSAPVLDKAWAKKSGAGWIGKNTNLITKKYGSYFFVAELIVDCAFVYDAPVPEYCGTCTRCIDACPTNAIEEPYIVNAEKCISYLTIELKDAIPENFKNKLDNWIFGCDVCQDVCPWNRFSKATTGNDFKPLNAISYLTEKNINNLSEELFDIEFKTSAIARTGYKGIIRNIKSAKG